MTKSSEPPAPLDYRSPADEHRPVSAGRVLLLIFYIGAGCYFLFVGGICLAFAVDKFPNTSRSIALIAIGLIVGGIGVGTIVFGIKHGVRAKR